MLTNVSRRSRYRVVPLLLGAWLLGSVVACGAPEPPSTRLAVLPASSLTDAANALAEAYSDATGATVDSSFGSSSSLARQIRDGAPADVFISASTDWISELQAGRATRGQPVVIAQGELLVVAQQESRLSAPDLHALLANLQPGDTIAIADPGVPAGEYARKALESVGLTEEYAPHLVGLSNVRAVLRAVELGEAHAGFVYGTDASAARVRILFPIDSSTHPPIRYQAAIVAQSLDPMAAQQFLDYLASDEARQQLLALGFSMPSGS